MSCRNRSHKIVFEYVRNIFRADLGSPVSHQLGLAIRRNEADRVLRLKLGELHTPEVEERRGLVKLLPISLSESYW